MTTNIKTIIFDFGGVLVDWDPRNLYRRYFPNNPEAMERFLSDVDFIEWNAYQDKGRPFQHGVAELSARFPQYRTLIQAYHEYWEESLVGDIPENVTLLKALKKKGYALYGLSNWSAETFPRTRAKYSFFDLFDDIVLSGEVRLIKPDPAIFQLLIKRTGKPPEECLLIDDSDKNIAVAKELGFQTIHFTTSAQLRAELQRLNILL